mgnify:CR=1 FL=1
MNQKSITLRINENNWDLLEQIEHIAKHDYRTKQTVIDALLRLGLAELEQSAHMIKANGNEKIIQILERSDMMQVCMRVRGKDIMGRPILEADQQTKNDCMIIQFPKQGE